MKKIEQYYKNTLNAQPHKNIIEFIKIEKKTGKAIELGCGAGRDTVYLIQNGWEVLAVDRENTQAIIKSKLDNSQFNRFNFMQSEFENVELPKNNLVVANYSIPFCSKNEFSKFWNKIINSIEKDRILCRKFFWKE